MNELYVGLISGTSADGIDAVLLDFADGPRVRATHFTPYPETVKDRIRRLSAGQYEGEPVDALGQLDAELGQLFAAAALALLRDAGVEADAVRAIGSHGQTVRHRPDGPHPFTLQIADPNVIASRTGIAVVADFRRRDVALGGQGAPLVPAFHRAVFSHASEARAVVNVGGIANVTLLSPDREVLGFDTGPGNVLMDEWMRTHHDKPFDEGGKFAATGESDDRLLEILLGADYFGAPPPKSTGPELFNRAWLDRALDDRKRRSEDVMATLIELTTRSIADALAAHAPDATRVFVCGGGAQNARLLHRLAAHLPRARVDTTQALGIHPDWVEAAAFAWLAQATLAGQAGNLPSVTGASRPAILGAIYPA